MKMILRSRIFCAALAGILSMCAMSSCASVPEPEAFNLTIQSLSHEVDGQDVILSATLSSGALRTFKCSFIYGNGPEETMSSVPAPFSVVWLTTPAIAGKLKYPPGIPTSHGTSSAAISLNETDIGET